jgi:hydroxymethylpyrimidine/phosphomethylpyrimidine kinase
MRRVNSSPVPRALTIAGSDSGGGAGIQADLKTFEALGAYGMSAITSVTAQNTVGVFGVYDLPPEFVAQQIDLVVQDIGVDAAKTGMLSNASIIHAVAESIRRNRLRLLVVDPVMVAKSGDTLLQESARDALVAEILPLAFVVTPNRPEAETLSGVHIATPNELHEAARAIHALGAKHVLIKGGHVDTPDAVDILFDGEFFHAFAAERIDTPNAHGTGCTFSAALTAGLARGLEIIEAVRAAKTYVSGAIRHSLSIGKGHGPLDHHWNCLQDSLSTFESASDIG